MQEPSEIVDEDSPLEEDEEESLVYVEFDGTTENNIFSNEKLKLDMIGLDMEHPIMRVNGRYYEGTYEDAVGTYMFFEKETNPVIEDPVFDRPAKLKYSMKTRKVLKMKRVFVKPRLEVLGDSNHPSCIPNMETIKEAGIPPSCQQEALNRWNDMRNERLEALNDYLEKQKIREEKRQQGIEPDTESDEDNPFAMYKPESNKVDKPVDSEFQKLTVIDPGPSTSKDNVLPCDLEPEVIDNRLPTNSNIQVKNRGYIAIYSKQKPKSNEKKGVKNRTDDKSDVNETQTSNIDNNTPEEIPSSVDVREETSKSAGESNERDEKSDTEALSQTSEENSQSEVAEQIPDKKMEKQMKRVAKIKEISERLKKTADEIKSKVNQ